MSKARSTAPGGVSFATPTSHRPTSASVRTSRPRRATNTSEELRMAFIEGEPALLAPDRYLKGTRATGAGSMTERLVAAPRSVGGSAIAVAATAVGSNTSVAEDLATGSFLRAHKELTAGVFDRAAATYDRLGPRVFAYFGRRLVARAGVMPGTTVLDVGTG